MLCYHGNNTPQGKTQADTVVLEVTVIDQEKGGLEEDEEGYGSLQREVGGGRERVSNFCFKWTNPIQGSLQQKSTAHCSGQMMRR